MNASKLSDTENQQRKTKVKQAGKEEIMRHISEVTGDYNRMPKWKRDYAKGMGGVVRKRRWERQRWG